MIDPLECVTDCGLTERGVRDLMELHVRDWIDEKHRVAAQVITDQKRATRVRTATRKQRAIIQENAMIGAYWP